MIKQNNRFNMTVIETNDLTITKLFENHIIPPENNGHIGKRGQAKDKNKSIYSSLHRARKKIFDYTIANTWQLWGTLTLNKLKINRYDLDKIQKKLSQYLKNVKKFKYPSLTWLIVPEQHKDKAWHFHLLLNGLPYDELRDIGKTYKNTNQKMYNWIDYENKFGYNSFIDISNVSIAEKYKISNYITKYITKDFCEFRENKKKYWSSKGLGMPNKSNTLLNYEEFQKMIKIKECETELIIHQKCYNFKNNVSGAIENTVHEFTEINKKAKIIADIIKMFGSDVVNVY